MFPLGSALLPSVLLPLHIFEPRYRAMMEVVMASAEHVFGVVLIERGHEVGGEDQRSNIGTLARVLETERADDGRWGVMSVGTERIRVVEWLDDDPFPRAMVEDWPDDSVPDASQIQTYEGLAARHRRLLGLTSELGRDVGSLPELAPDVTLASFQLAATAPISNFDRQRMLSAPTLTDRLPMLAESLDAALSIVEMELGQSFEGD